MSDFDWFVIYVTIGIWLACGIGGFVILVCAYRKPPNDTDRRLAAIDRELTERERHVARSSGGWRH